MRDCALLVLIALLTGCGPQAQSGPSKADELNSGGMLRVRFGMDAKSLKSTMSSIKLNRNATEMSETLGSRVYHETLDQDFNFKLVHARYIVKKNELASIELEYDADVYDFLRKRLQTRWGEGIAQGVAGHRWRGNALTAMLTPSMLGGHCRLTLNRRYGKTLKPEPLR